MNGQQQRYTIIPSAETRGEEHGWYPVPDDVATLWIVDDAVLEVACGAFESRKAAEAYIVEEERRGL